MMRTYVQLAFLFVVFGGDALGQFTRGAVSNDGLCTYTFRDVCVSQRMRDVVELRAVVDSLQAQLTLVNKVVAAIPDLRTTMKQLEVKIDDVKDKTQEETGTDNQHSSRGGAVYIRWGRKTCSGNDTELLYWGVVAGSLYTHSGGGSNYLCMPRDPDWGPKTTAGFQSGGHLYGAEYEIQSNDPFSKANAQSLHNNDIPCAVCLVASRQTKLMFPAKLTCPDGWTKEYSGYLMAEHYTHKGRTTYVCMDNAPEVILGGGLDKNGVLFYVIEATCGGALPCPNYVDGWEITCVVCTK
ncbi:hypothetical protein LSAT2_007226 [Lamellibrachia satsuma]|nr:hypothetical protein LSAT2_007226 [Lamellibrachia satsuma]